MTEHVNVADFGMSVDATGEENVIALRKAIAFASERGLSVVVSGIYRLPKLGFRIVGRTKYMARKRHFTKGKSK